jgi:hypothetical protein
MVTPSHPFPPTFVDQDGFDEACLDLQDEHGLPLDSAMVREGKTFGSVCCWMVLVSASSVPFSTVTPRTSPALVTPTRMVPPRVLAKAPTFRRPPGSHLSIV